jgi:hypothetical protein
MLVQMCWQRCGRPRMQRMSEGLWATGLTLLGRAMELRRQPNLRRLVRRRSFRQPRVASAEWMERHFELIDASAPGPERIGTDLWDWGSAARCGMGKAQERAKGQPAGAATVGGLDRRRACGAQGQRFQRAHRVPGLAAAGAGGSRPRRPRAHSGSEYQPGLLLQSERQGTSAPDPAILAAHQGPLVALLRVEMAC